MGRSLSFLVADAIADKICKRGIFANRPEVCLLPQYDTAVDRELKLFVVPSNITTDTIVGRDTFRQLFATQLMAIKYIPDSRIEAADEALKVLEDVSVEFVNEKLYFGGIWAKVKTVVMVGASEVLWNGDYQIDGLLRNSTFAEADTMATSFVIVSERFVAKDRNG